MGSITAPATGTDVSATIEDCVVKAVLALRHDPCVLRRWDFQACKGLWAEVAKSQPWSVSGMALWEGSLAIPSTVQAVLWTSRNHI